MKIRVFLVFFIISLVVLQTAFFTFTLFSYDSKLSKYKIDEEKFIHAVDYACSNYLQSVLAPLLETKHSGLEKSVRQNTVVVFLPDIGFASSYRGDKQCIIQGATFRRGDYCQYGLIVAVGDDRLYCDDGDKYVVVRKGLTPHQSRKAGSGAQCVPGSASEAEEDEAPF